MQPAPSRPNNPTISPAWTVRSRSRTRARRSSLGSKTLRPRTASAADPITGDLAGADHLRDHLRPRDAPYRMVAVDGAVAHDDDAIGNGEDLGQAMGNEDYR